MGIKYTHKNSEFRIIQPGDGRIALLLNKTRKYIYNYSNDLQVLSILLFLPCNGAMLHQPFFSTSHFQVQNGTY